MISQEKIQNYLPHGSKTLQPAHAIPMHQKSYDSIIFDIGNVLISWQPTIIAEQLFPETKAVTIIQALTKDVIWLEFDRGTIDLDDLINHAVAHHKFDRILTSQLLVAIAHHLPLFLVMEEVLLRAKAQGYKIYILSNMPKSFYEILVKNFDFFNHCDGIVASYQINHIKPEPGIYKHLLQEFNINPHTAIFIDDIEDNIAAANALNIDGIVCKNVAEVAHLLEKNNILKKK